MTDTKKLYCMSFYFHDYNYTGKEWFATYDEAKKAAAAKYLELCDDHGVEPYVDPEDEEAEETEAEPIVTVTLLDANGAIVDTQDFGDRRLADAFAGKYVANLARKGLSGDVRFTSHGSDADRRQALLDRYDGEECCDDEGDSKGPWIEEVEKPSTHEAFVEFMNRHAPGDEIY